jgi:hypothetical protein
MWQEKILEKEKICERNNKKKNEIAYSKVLLHVTLFLVNSIKIYILPFFFFFFFRFSNAEDILQI